jgi:hypothetical protein
VVSEEYWGVCNGISTQGRSVRSSLQKEMLHFNREACGVATVQLTAQGHSRFILILLRPFFLELHGKLIDNIYYAFVKELESTTRETQVRF